MKFRKLTFGTVAALALAVNAGCQSISTQAVTAAPQVPAKTADHLDVTLYRVKLSNPLSDDIDWAKLNRDLSGEGASTFDDAWWSKSPYPRQNSIDKIEMSGRSKVGDRFSHDGKVNPSVTPQMLQAALANQGSVSQVMADSYPNVPEPGAKDGKINGRHLETVAFVPAVQCAGDGTKMGAAEATSITPGLWLSQLNVAFTPMRKVADRFIRFEFAAEMISEGKIQDCDYSSNVLTSTDDGKSASLESRTMFLEPGYSFMFTGVRENGIDRSLEYSEPGKPSAKANEVLVLLVKPSLQ